MELEEDGRSGVVEVRVELEGRYWGNEEVTGVVVYRIKIRKKRN